MNSDFSRASGWLKALSSYVQAACPLIVFHRHASVLNFKS